MLLVDEVVDVLVEIEVGVDEVDEVVVVVVEGEVLVDVEAAREQTDNDRSSGKI